MDRNDGHPGQARPERACRQVPVPRAARHYLAHVIGGHSIRELARRAGCHPSTVMRQIRRFELRRDDPLVDSALGRLGRMIEGEGDNGIMSGDRQGPEGQDEDVDLREAEEAEARFREAALGVLRRLCAPGAVLAVAPDLDRAAVVREGAGGEAAAAHAVDLKVAEAMALRDWIACARPGRVARYHVTAQGRAALREMLAEAENRATGMAEASAAFAGKRPQGAAVSTAQADAPRRGRRQRYGVDSPLAALARRRDSKGRPFLAPELVVAGERLQEDFELAQLGPRVAQDWDRLLTGADRPGTGGSGPAEGSAAARERVVRALAELGPGLGDVVLRCCCFMEGLEETERRLGWSARSGKVVLRIALERLKRHYEETYGPHGPRMG